MRDTAIMLITLLALIGLCLILGLGMKFFNKDLQDKKQSNEDFLMDTMGNGCGVIMILFGFGVPLLGIIMLIFD